MANEKVPLDLTNEPDKSLAYTYIQQRIHAYPSLQDQADMQYWDAVNGTTTWQDAIKAVKDAHPKPEEQRMVVDTTSWKEIT